MNKKIDVNVSIKERNNQIAGKNRKLFKQHCLRVINLIGSPGCGKTTLLEATAEILRNRLAVIVGDVMTAQDADRILKKGCQAVQIQTGGACHLNADMLRKAFSRINPSKVEVLVIENVGNLVCPSTFDLGEDSKIAMLSLPEGDDKPSKYPALFMRANAVVINKIDLKPILDYNLERVKADCRKFNSKAEIMEVSAKTGHGVDKWIEYLHRSL